MLLVFVSVFILFQFGSAQNATGEYDDDSGTDQSTGNLEDLFVTVNAKGQVFPFRLNPIERNTTETPIETIVKKKIIGGKESNKGSVPYIVNIVRSGMTYCGGSIYNSKTVLSAAHCFVNKDGKLPESSLKKYTYVAGDFDIDDMDKNEQRRQGVKVDIHSKYNPKYSFYDIAVITVDPPFEYNKFVQPLPIDKPPLVPEKAGSAMISGWGYTKKKEKYESKPDQAAYYPNLLREANVHVFTKEECLNFYRSYYKLKPLINAGLICAGFESGKIDACQGDSGGPLACYNPDKKYRRYLCGIVSTGVGCGLPNFPGFYTRVSEFHNWVIEIAGYADRRTIDDSRGKIKL